MLGVIGHLFATDGNPNILTIHGARYFFDRGREQTDGAITGKLFEMLPNDMAQFAGHVRIEPDGTITRFPRIRQYRSHVNATFAATPEDTLAAWSRGCI